MWATGLLAFRPFRPSRPFKPLEPKNCLEVLTSGILGHKAASGCYTLGRQGVFSPRRQSSQGEVQNSASLRCKRNPMYQAVTVAKVEQVFYLPTLCIHLHPHFHFGVT